MEKRRDGRRKNQWRADGGKFGKENWEIEKRRKGCMRWKEDVDEGNNNEKKVGKTDKKMEMKKRIWNKRTI